MKEDALFLYSVRRESGIGSALRCAHRGTKGEITAGRAKRPERVARGRWSGKREKGVRSVPSAWWGLLSSSGDSVRVREKTK